MTVKKKRELFSGPLLTYRSSFASPHQETFDQGRFSCKHAFFKGVWCRGKPSSGSPSTPNAQPKVAPQPRTRNAKGKKKARNPDAKSRFLSSSWSRKCYPGSLSIGGENDWVFVWGTHKPSRPQELPPKDSQESAHPNLSHFTLLTTKTELSYVLGPTNPCPTAVHMEPFSTSVFKVLI